MSEMEIYKGLGIKHPEYSIITPQTLQEFTIRSLRVTDEENMKASLVTPAKLVQHLNECIWNCLVKKPENIKTYEDFINKITIKDRDALMYALYHITYKEIHNYDITCPDCDKKYPVSLKISQAFSMEVWKDNESILEKEVKVKLPIAENIHAIVKQPILKQEQDLTNDMLFQGEKNLSIGTEMLVIDRLEVDQLEAKSPIIIRNRDNLFRAYNDLPSMDRKAINKTYIDQFGKYGIKLMMISTCNFCNKTNDTNIDLVTQFFRAMYE